MLRRPAILNRWTHHVFQRVPFAMRTPPPGARSLLIGANRSHVLLACAGTLARMRDAAGEGDGLPTLCFEGAPEGNSTKWWQEAEIDIEPALANEAVLCIFAPSLTNGQVGETVVLEHLATALRKTPGWRGEIWMYESTIPLWPNAGIDISGWIDRKVELLHGEGCDATEIEAACGLNRYRGLRPMVACAEAYLVLGRRDFLREWQRWHSRGSD